MASEVPGTKTRTRPGPSTTTPGITWSVAGGADGAASSRPRPTAPSIQESSITAVTSPPEATTWTTGDTSPPAMASSRTTLRPRGGTASRELPWGAMAPPTPKTVTSTVAALPPGLAMTRRSRRVGSPPPATSQASLVGARHGVATRPRSSESSLVHVWSAARPAAREPDPATSPATGPASAVLTTAPRVDVCASGCSADVADTVMSPAPSTTITWSRAAAGAAAAYTVVVPPATAGTPARPSVSGPGQCNAAERRGTR